MSVSVVQCFSQSLPEEWEQGGSAQARAEYFYGTRAFPYTRIPQDARLRAIQHSQQHLRQFHQDAGLQRATDWKPIGPFDVGGCITSIALHPTDSMTLWVAAADGGVWKSTNRGEQWKPVMDFEKAITMGAIAVDPINPDILYAGTGEAAYNVDSYSGAGVLKSVDGGATWFPSGLTTVAAFAQIAVSPKDHNVVMAAAIRNNAGLYRSTNAGATWTRIISSPVTDITINPINPDEVWIGERGYGVRHSTDAGRSFAPSNSGIGLNDAFIGRVSVQVAPSQPTTLYALVDEASYGSSGVSNHSRIYKSTNSGATWRNVLDDKPNLLNYFGISQGEYNNVIAVKPDDPDVVIAGGVILVRSTNGGETWTAEEITIHPDHHAIMFDPTNSQRVYLGNDGGMYRSDNAGIAYRRISKGLAITQFYAMAVDQQADNVTYGGTQDNGTISNIAAGYWENEPGVIGSGDGFYVIVDPINPSVVFYERSFGAMQQKNLSTGASQLFTQGINLNDPNDRAAWSAPFILDPTDPTRFYCGRRKVYRRTLTTPWTPISPSFRTPISAIAVSEVNPAILYAGTGMSSGNDFLLLNEGIPLGEVKVSMDNGKTWVDRSVGSGLPNRAVTEILTSHVDSCTAWIAYSGFYSGHIFKTTNCGATWQDISMGLPDIPVNALAVHPEDEQILYAGTDIGMYITTEGGAHWADYSQGLPKAVVADLTVHHATRTLRLATHGRSMWEIPLEPASPRPAIIVPSGREVWMGGSKHYLSWSGFTPPVRIEYSLDNGSSWTTIADTTDGTTYQWKVVDTAATNANIRIVSIAAPQQNAHSLSFTIERSRPGGVITGSQKALGCWGLAYDGKTLWATVENSDTILKIDPVTLSTIAVIRVSTTQGRRSFTDITFHPTKGTLFVHDVRDASPDNAGSGLLHEIDTLGNVLHTWVSPCRYPTGLGYLANAGGNNGALLAADLFGSQDLFLIDPDNGSTLRAISRPGVIELGPMGITAAADGKNFWQIIDAFDPNTGPQGSTAVELSLEGLSAGCVFPLNLTDDSASAGGYSQWGRLFARGVERDPGDGNLWVTNLDGGIYKFTVCKAVLSTTPDLEPSDQIVADIEQNTPNPFSTSTTITFTVRRASDVSLTLHDATGRSIALLAKGKFEAGGHSFSFNPVGLAAGAYQYRLTVDGKRLLSKTMIYIP
ncbi:MAG: hypothetical protein IT211_03160 [Armatimonadetes bacterium]|nr:hypothetical protein [Armatimonadota bacterium]